MIVAFGPHSALLPLEGRAGVVARTGVTINAAMKYSKESREGSIAVGILADLATLSRDPLRLDAERLFDLRILGATSHGRTVQVRH
jgi:predicted amidohydrolase YtcJ